MECPNCHSVEGHRVIWSTRNLMSTLSNALNSLFLLGFWPFVSWKRVTAAARPLKRRCLKCGYKFVGEQPELPDFDECARCGYNLKGNVTGRCPECGWRLSLRHRAYRRIADRAMRDGQA